MEQWDVLGPAEKLIAKQVHSSLVESARIAKILSQELSDLAEVDIEEAMLDPRKKDTLLAIAERFTTLPENLSGISLVMTIMKIIFDPVS